MALIKSRYQKIPVRTWFLTFAGKISECLAESTESARLWKNPQADEYLRIYSEVGRIWGWTGRLLKTREELAALLQSPENEVWLFYSGNELAGFFELVRAGAETEIVYLGLLPEWIGKGLGQTLIRTAVAMAGKNGEKVWLHTCERDHPSALKSYLKAGFVVENEHTLMEYYPE